MYHLKAALWPDFLRQLSRVVLMMSHMAGVAPFTWPRPCIGRFRGTSQMSPPKVYLDSPKAILAEWDIFWSIVKVHSMGSLGTSTL